MVGTIPIITHHYDEEDGSYVAKRTIRIHRPEDRSDVGCLPMFLARGRDQAGQLDIRGAVVAIEDPWEQPMEGLDAADLLNLHI